MTVNLIETMATTPVKDGIDVSRAWIQTVSGGIFHILEPRQDEILIMDIGHALGMMCRFTGHVRRFYSVAEHSVHASRLVPAEDALWALMHDASEAYIADINRPLKHYTEVGPSYLKTEKTIMDAICLKFHMSTEQPATVTAADAAMLYAEKEQLLPVMDWGTKWADDITPAQVQIRCWSPEVAKVEFLHRFYELTNQL